MHRVQNAMSSLEPGQGHQVAVCFRLLQARLLRTLAEGVQDLAFRLWVGGVHSGIEPGREVYNVLRGVKVLHLVCVQDTSDAEQTPLLPRRLRVAEAQDRVLQAAAAGTLLQVPDCISQLRDGSGQLWRHRQRRGTVASSTPDARQHFGCDPAFEGLGFLFLGTHHEGVQPRLVDVDLLRLRIRRGGVAYHPIHKLVVGLLVLLAHIAA